MDYNHTSETSETYDPDSKVVRSTQTVEQNATDTNGGGSGAVSVASALPGASSSSGSGDSTNRTPDRTEETTNYEISKTVTTSTVGRRRREEAVGRGGGRRHRRRQRPAYKPRSAAGNEADRQRW